MSEQRSKQTKTEDVSHVDSLLSLLGDLSKRDPSPALRARLGILASKRLSQNPRPVGRGPRAWLKPAIAFAFLIGVGLAMGFAIHIFERQPAKNSETAKVNLPAVSPEPRIHSLPAVRVSVRKLPRVHHSHPIPVGQAGPQQMTLRLPYSNSTIQTGTGTTIRVSMSQSELLSLGFPINATVPDRRVIAELTLGGDGLPSAISVPLPLEVMKEKK